MMSQYLKRISIFLKSCYYTTMSDSRNPRVLHRVLCIRLWLLHFKSKIKQEKRRYATQTQSHSPDSVEMVHPKDPQENETDKVGDDKCRVDHAIGGCIHMVHLISRFHGRCKRHEDSPRTKSRCCLALGMSGSSVFSAAATEPVGYSPPNSIHSLKTLRDP